MGGDLLVLDQPPQEGFARVLRELERSPQGKPTVISYNRDYEPFARRRDHHVRQLIENDFHVEVHTERDHLLIEPGELPRPAASNRPYFQLYSPFARNWFEKLQSPEIQARIQASNQGPSQFKGVWRDLLSPDTFPDQLEWFHSENQKKVGIHIPLAGRKEALSRVAQFSAYLAQYKDRRDFPAEKGTSQLSVFLKNGSLTVADIIRELGLHSQSSKAETSKTKYLKELVWREFYYHILWHCPRVETESFIERYGKIRWENNEEYFDAWKRGDTGYPLVDAGMRELKSTGWMHNRVRMVVASFLTKDLLIDWRWGERYFMEQLLDGDLALNNGGWQWAASTGCDPQPYFRIFNPVLQSQKFDPNGRYIKMWVPEAGNLAGEVNHEPVSPIVDHFSRKEIALRIYSACDEEKGDNL